MAVIVIDQEKTIAIDKPTVVKTEYFGLSSDTKPTDCDAGSTFYETDTKFAFLFDGSVWSRMFNEVIDTYHALVHAGRMFTISKTFRAVPQNGFGRIHILTGAKEVHFTFSFTAEAKAYLNTYAGTTYSNNGTIQPVFNRKPGSGLTPGFQAWHTPTVNVLGSLRGDDFVGSGGNVQTQAGGSGAEGMESVIPPNTDFMFSLQNVETAAKDLGFIINCYEV